MKPTNNWIKPRKSLTEKNKESDENMPDVFKGTYENLVVLNVIERKPAFTEKKIFVKK